MMGRTTNLAFAPLSDHTVALVDDVDPLDGDTIGFEAWLLPPAELSPTERIVAAVSKAAGPAAFIGGCVLLLPLLR